MELAWLMNGVLLGLFVGLCLVNGWCFAWFKHVGLFGLCMGIFWLMHVGLFGLCMGFIWSFAWLIYELL